MSGRTFYLCDGDGAGWAVDEDRRLTLAALEGFARRVSDPREAEMIHACWWRPLMDLPASALTGRRVICHMTGDPARCLGEPDFLASFNRVNLWIAQSREALARLQTLGVASEYVPYAVDAECYSTPGPDTALTAAARNRIPAGEYVIANFHRDTAGFAATPPAGPDGLRAYAPKMVKGPDVFVEILAELKRLGEPVLALLAGPRRHWVRQQLASRGVPFVFAGEETAGDDYPKNILGREQIAQLYGLASLCLVTSRSEGGPRAVLEAAAAGRATLSTPVGHAPEVLAPECLFRDAMEAVEKVRADIRQGLLRRFAPAHREIVHARHSVKAVRESLEVIYSGTGRTAPAAAAGRAWKRPPERPAAKAVISFWNKFTPPPWGGGNQFMMALMAQARRQGHECVINGEGIDGRPAAHIVNSVQFDMERFESIVRPGAGVLHRIDGPISVLRGTPESLEQDRRCFEFNEKYACATVIQSWHTLAYLAELGLRPVRPALILNACDPAVFRRAPEARRPGSRIRVIATSWSPSPGKGAAVYQWLDEHLDPRRFEFTFVGNCPVKLKSARVLAPLPSEELADVLREQDVYLTASRNDPCSNALIEALSCGLPAVYLDSGGHPELTAMGGLPFTMPREIPGLIERIAANIDFYRRLVAPESIADVCSRYLALLLGEASYRD